MRILVTLMFRYNGQNAVLMLALFAFLLAPLWSSMMWCVSHALRGWAPRRPWLVPVVAGELALFSLFLAAGPDLPPRLWPVALGVLSWRAWGGSPFSSRRPAVRPRSGRRGGRSPPPRSPGLSPSS